MEFIKATPPAAAVPPKKAVGKLQNGPSVLQMPDAARQRERKAANGWLLCRKKTASPRPRQPAKAGSATCHFLSRVLSEWPATITMQIEAARYGTAESMATVELLRPEKVLTICGSQKATP